MMPRFAKRGHARARRGTVVRQIDTPAWPSRGPAQMENEPKFTRALGERGPLADTVAIEFVVSEHGRALSSTARPDYAGLPTADDHKTRFARRLMQSLPDFRFTEAYISGCAVPQFVRQGFAYRISPDAR